MGVVLSTFKALSQINQSVANLQESQSVCEFSRELETGILDDLNILLVSTMHSQYFCTHQEAKIGKQRHRDTLPEKENWKQSACLAGLCVSFVPYVRNVYRSHKCFHSKPKFSEITFSNLDNISFFVTMNKISALFKFV